MTTTTTIARDIAATKADRARDAYEAAKPIHSRTYCGTGAVVVIMQDTAEIRVIPIRCKTWGCPVCGPILARQWGERIAEAQPERFLTLTCEPSRFDNPQQAYEAMNAAFPKLIRLIRQHIGPCEYARVYEAQENGYPHLHVATKGKYLPQRWISRTWDRLGIGTIVDIRQIPSKRGAARYMTKYMTKTAGSASLPFKPARIITTSRGFFPPKLIEESPTNDVCQDFGHTLAHAGEAVEYLVRHYGYRLVGDPGARIIRLERGPHSPSPIPRDRLLSELAALGHR